MNQTTSLAIRVTELPRVLMAFYGSGRTPFFRGQPGCGKTDLVHQGAAQISARLEEMNIESPKLSVYELHLASMSEVDIRGYLIPTDDGDAKFTKPVFADFVSKHPRGILFLDEFPQATHEVQKAVAPLILEGRIGDYKLPSGWMVACAGNREQDNAGINNMLGHVINRLSIIDVKPPETDDWVFWAAANHLSPEIVAFAKIVPGTVFGEPDLTANDQPYCTPRSLHALDNVAQRWPGGIMRMIEDQTGCSVIQGFIGAGAMAELRGVLNLASKLPTYDEVVKDPKKAKVPQAANEQYAAVMMIALRAKLEHAKEVIGYITRFQPNMVIVGIASLIARDRAFTHSSELAQWLRDNRSLVQKLTSYIQVSK